MKNKVILATAIATVMGIGAVPTFADSVVDTEKCFAQKQEESTFVLTEEQKKSLKLYKVFFNIPIPEGGFDESNISGKILNVNLPAYLKENPGAITIPYVYAFINADKFISRPEEFYKITFDVAMQMMVVSDNYSKKYGVDAKGIPVIGGMPKTPPTKEEYYEMIRESVVPVSYTFEEYKEDWRFEASSHPVMREIEESFEKSLPFMTRVWQTYDHGSKYLGGYEYLTGWCTIDEKKYYFNDEEYLVKGWTQYKDGWYYLDEVTGEHQTKWKKVRENWYFLGNGSIKESMYTGWKHLNQKWYYLGSKNDGAMKNGWQFINGSWYYLGDINDGAMKTGWIKTNENWYFLNNSGDMAKNTWIGPYFVNDQGLWVK